MSETVDVCFVCGEPATRIMCWAGPDGKLVEQSEGILAPHSCEEHAEEAHRRMEEISPGLWIELVPGKPGGGSLPPPGYQRFVPTPPRPDLGDPGNE